MISKQSLPLNCVASQTSHLLIPSIPAFSPRIFSVDKNCSAKAAALCTEEKARLSIFVFYRRRRKRKSWKKNMFSFSEIGPYRFFLSEVTTKALGTYIRDLRDLRLIHRKPLPLPRVEVLHPENLPGSLHHSCICCASAFLCHFCPFCTCQATQHMSPINSAA